MYNKDIFIKMDEDDYMDLDYLNHERIRKQTTNKILKSSLI